MAYPGNLPAAAVSGTLLDWNDVPLKSALMTFTPSINRVADPTDGSIFYKTTSVPTCTSNASTGVFTVNLIPTDDPDETPIDWYYTVHITGMDNASTPQPIDYTEKCVVVHDQGTLKLAALIQPDGIPPNTLNPIALTQLADFDNTTPATNGQVPSWNATTSKWTPGNASGSVVSVNGHSGPTITLGPSDLGAAAASDVLLKASNLSDLASATAARTNLGLGSAATQASSAFGAASDTAAALAGLAQLKGTIVYVEDYGAVGNGTTDDTTAIKNAINAAVTAAAASGNNYAEVRFQAKTYLVAGSLVQGGSTFGNAVIPLPIIGMTAATVTLCFKGVGESSALPIWTNTSAQKTGTVIKTTVSGTNDATYGEACVVGGPNRKQGYGTSGGTGTWNNMQVVIDGVQMQLPTNPNICGWDFDGTAQAIVKSASVYTNTGVTTTVVPTTSWQFGIRMPSTNNQSLQIIDRYSVEGCCYGVVMTEHTVMRNYYALYCLVGIQCSTSAAMPHSSTILYANVEWCQTVIQSDGNRFNIYAHQIDIEVGNGGGVPPGFGIFRYIADPSNLFRGYIGFQYPNDDTSYLSLTSALVEGGKFCRIIDLSRPTGAATAALTVPATTVPARNTYYRDAFVIVGGTTFSAIKVDSQTVLTAAGAVMVPAGKYIELDYASGTATWIWTLL